MTNNASTGRRIAVLIPCFNEAATIRKVVQDFREALPEATIYVYDNASSDDTAAIAMTAGAIVRREGDLGKGNVVRRMFADIEADVFVLADGDDTYDASACHEMVDKLLSENVDMVNGRRIAESDVAFRSGHRFGNQLFTFTISHLFGRKFGDILSGYKVMSRRLVKSFPITSQGFEIETELCVHALELNMAVREVPVAYQERPEGSQSKLRKFRDGFRILGMILLLLKAERPLAFFSTIFAVLCAVSLALGLPLVVEYLSTGLVPRFPTAVLSAAVMLLAFLSLTVGLVLDTVTLGRKETKRLHYLSFGAPASFRQ